MAVTKQIMQKLKMAFLLCLLLLWGLSVQGQEQVKKNLYFKLDKEKIDYNKKVYERTVTIKTTRKSTGYGFLIRCTCHPGGWISFLGHNNPEVGEVSEPMRVISDSAYKKLEFISFDELVRLLKQYDLKFNDKYNLYFVEPNEKEKDKYTVYNVKLSDSFIHAQ
ncbi:hypothetical protein [Pontibacter chitinilyticus]|uniref:hypothetical protein n=1 Tax=Pontibacter chitinilyticus TaxID=2674989 RepID=UPI003219C0F9